MKAYRGGATDSKLTLIDEKMADRFVEAWSKDGMVYFLGNIDAAERNTVFAVKIDGDDVLSMAKNLVDRYRTGYEAYGKYLTALREIQALHLESIGPESRLRHGLIRLRGIIERPLESERD